MRRFAALVFVVLAAAVALQPAAPARADGDPCSDYLLVGSLCPPNNPRPSQPQINRTQKTIDAAKQGGYEIRVAVIGSPTDLGSVPVFFGRPAPYAKFLDAELQSAWSGKLLVVMAAGYGVRDHTKPYLAGVKALQGLPPPANGTPDALMAAATVAVRKLAASEGVKVPVIPLAKTVTPPPATRFGLRLDQLRQVRAAAGGRAGGAGRDRCGDPVLAGRRRRAGAGLSQPGR